jgi:hypothetical protein
MRDMKMDRSVINRIHLKKDEDDGYINANRAELIAMVWEITKDSWSFVRGANVEQRLQRDVAMLIRRKS